MPFAHRVQQWSPVASHYQAEEDVQDAGQHNAVDDGAGQKVRADVAQLADMVGGVGIIRLRYRFADRVIQLERWRSKCGGQHIARFVIEVKQRRPGDGTEGCRQDGRRDIAPNEPGQHERDRQANAEGRKPAREKTDGKAKRYGVVPILGAQ